ncbi:Shedu anti-phage system protein SduA domain-containing protein [Gluconacetobacter asukensis]|uniref:DUF4263 domain-containing protein n=1 Tax=Gluconacetobacter asukensis TaxID=1017181 RepID=A0A7W4J3X0_9PROT|nr:Shedu anti-phage system protein SduA domain-containing protein [Gluconacetobacter asukensis]MBB2174186.1 DUF4263 domain-containing protein [Gluconacetobacter asukensis]
MKRVLKEQIWSEFIELMDATPPHSEEVFHQFLVKYPALIPVWRPLDGVVYSKFKLGNEHVTDFAFVRDDTPGLRWTFIEIEKPSDRLLRKDGSPTAALTHAIGQLHQWTEWFRNNLDYVKNNWPHGTRARKIGMADPHFILVMGRREGDLWEKRALLQRFGGGVQVRTFDGLKHNLSSPAVDNDATLRCLSYSSSGWDKLLSSMKLEISYYST